MDYGGASRSVITAKMTLMSNDDAVKTKCQMVNSSKQTNKRSINEQRPDQFHPMQMVGIHIHDGTGPGARVSNYES